MLVSTELELPVISLADFRPPRPAIFETLWERLSQAGWTPDGFGVTREHGSAGPCIKSGQAMSTDTGPVIELAPSPAATLGETARQLGELQAEAREALASLGYAMLGCGVHPSLHPLPKDYFRFRTPRPSYDYALDTRGWSHWTIVDKASVQEIVDVPFRDAPRAIRMLHRLSGVMNFLFRNDPDLHGLYGGRLSVRSLAWRQHVPRIGRFVADGGKVVLPAKELCDWAGYMSMLWNEGPMFLVGTKDSGQVYVPEHPTILGFLRDAPPEGWATRNLAGLEGRLVPEAAHLAHTDWSYMGFARIRWKWPERGAGAEEILEAWERGRIEELLERNLEKVVVENRCNSTQPPGEDLASLALVAGLVANLDEAADFAFEAPWDFWCSLLEASTTLPFDAMVGGRSVPELVRAMVDIARRGLSRRGEPDADRLLAPVEQRLEERISPSERMVRELRKGGFAALFRMARI